MNLAQLRVLDGTCALAAAAAFGGMLYVGSARHASVTCQSGHPTAFGPATGPPEWMFFLLFAAVIILGAVSAFVLRPAIRRTKAKGASS